MRFLITRIKENLELRLAEISYSSYVDQFYLFLQKISFIRKLFYPAWE